MPVDSLGFRWLISFFLTLLLIGLGWYYLVVAQYTSSKQANVSVYQAAQKAIVESTARAATSYITRELQHRGGAAIPAIEQEVLRLFVEPVRVNVYGDVWIYTPTYAVYDHSSDFRAAFMGKSIGDIFKLRSQEDSRTRPHSFADLVHGVTHAQPGTTLYTWQPNKAAEFAPWWDRLTHDAGWEIAAWTTAVVFPGTAQERVWIVGMSSMLTEVMRVSGAYSRIQSAISLMVIGTLCGGLFLVLLWRSDRAWQVAELQRVNHDITQAYDATIQGLVSVLEWRDADTTGHCNRVTDLTVQLARALKVSEAEIVHIRRGAILHDIGKLAIPDHILLKPDKLTPEEYAIMQRHTEYGHQMLASVPFLQSAIDIPHYHHEKWDGTGYPSHLKGEQIPLSARIFAVVDVYDALSSDRPYKQAWLKEHVRHHLYEQSGTHFDPHVVDVFLNEVLTDHSPS